MGWFSKPKNEEKPILDAGEATKKALVFRESKNAIKSAFDSLDFHYDEVDGPDGNVIVFPLTDKDLGTVLVITSLDTDGESLQFKIQLQ